jgi:SAM-dependent methyltransferase
MPRAVAPVSDELYREKDVSYFGTPRLDLLELLPKGGRLALLDIGAGDGATLRAAKRAGLAAYTVAIDRTASAPAAPEEAIDRFIVGDVEAMALDLPPASFDAILFGDVLEHLVDPWRVLRRMAALLRPGGLALASVPNFRNFRALRPIVLGGDFRYEPAGILDRSHLRFFCRKNILELFEQSGLQIVDMRENMGGYGLRLKIVDALTLYRLHELFVFQYLVRATKPG